MVKSAVPDQIGAVCSGSTLFVSILNSSVMLGNYLQQVTSADEGDSNIEEMNLKCKHLLNRAICRKPNQNHMKNKKVIDVCITDN